MKHTAIALFAMIFFFALDARAQKDTIYFTDSDVKRSRVTFGIHYDPLFTQRRIVQFQGDGSDAKDKYPANGSYGDIYGVHIDFRINQGLMLGVGFGQSNIRYQLENFTLHHSDLPNDSALGNVDIAGSYYSIPLRIGFVSPLNELWNLEIWVPVSYNFLKSYSESIDISGENMAFDRTEEANASLWSVGIKIGASFRFADSWSIGAHGQFQYTTRPMYVDGMRPESTPYGVGLSLGLRYHF